MSIGVGAEEASAIEMCPYWQITFTANHASLVEENVHNLVIYLVADFVDINTTLFMKAAICDCNSSHIRII